MGKDEYNTLEDLVFSRSFRNWIQKGDTPEAGFWLSWQETHPDKLELINHAKAIIYALQLHLQPLSDEAVDSQIKKVLEKLQDGRIGLPREISPRPARQVHRPARAWTLAAAFAGCCILAWTLQFYLHHRQPGSFRSFLTSNPSKPIRQQTGDAGRTHTLTLPDGSTVRLDPGSKLYYPDGLLTTGRREVFLEGTAFFDITRNAAHPFYVYTNAVITKVLGTSFRITTIGTNARTIVTVATGKVSVYHKPDLSDGIILTPNQQVTYNPVDARLDRSIADQPVKLIAVNDTDLLFNYTPLPTVFHRLQALYGIPILYDEETMATCSLTVTMGDGSFYERLNLICKAIGASYEAIDGTIVITGKNCKKL
jgi:transmembrane sensor